MKHFLLLALAVLTINVVRAQTKSPARSGAMLSYEGLHVARTVTVATGADSTTIYMYLRFYKDGTVYTQAVNGYAPADVAKWLGKKGRFERKGTYTIKGSRIDFTVNNSESEDLPLEGPMTDIYSGKWATDNSLDLQLKYSNGCAGNYRFAFVRTE